MPALGILGKESGFLSVLFLFPAAHVPLFLYPFLNTTSKTRPFEYLRLTSLGVIGAIVKVRSWCSPIPLGRDQKFVLALHTKKACASLEIVKGVGEYAIERNVF